MQDILINLAEEVLPLGGVAGLVWWRVLGPVIRYMETATARREQDAKEHAEILQVCKEARAVSTKAETHAQRLVESDIAAAERDKTLIRVLESLQQSMDRNTQIQHEVLAELRAARRAS